ncbi:MAG: iron-containing alcohol dehydrogenase [Victivallaceae bacterium]|nr:iron-containing alcohol dehydrogenase [Victivallaceae bacterium]
MSSSYQLLFPGKTVFGRGKFAELAEELAALKERGKFCYVTGRHGADLVRQTLLLRTGGVVFSEISPEVTLAEIDALVDTARENCVRYFVGVGGGSAMDAAKAGALLYHHEEPAAEFFYGRAKLDRRRVGLILAPTTAGTGAEATANAVLRDPVTEIKQSIRHATMHADLAVVDPALTDSCPARVTACSGMDAFTQAVESFLSIRANDFTSPLALRAVQMIFHALPGAFRGETAARDLMAEASMITGIAFAQSGLGAVHGLCHPLGSVLHLGHGESCALLLESVLRRNFRAVPEKFAVLAKACDCDSAEQWIAAVAALRDQLGLPGTLKTGQLTEEKIQFILANCRSGSMKCNPVFLPDEEVRALLTEQRKA